eukprot:120639-Pleurochrysis_carterae.AAC.1
MPAYEFAGLSKRLKRSARSRGLVPPATRHRVDDDVEPRWKGARLAVLVSPCVDDVVPANSWALSAGAGCVG